MGLNDPGHVPLNREEIQNYEKFVNQKWLIGKNEVLFVVYQFQNFDSLQTCIKSADPKNNELHN